MTLWLLIQTGCHFCADAKREATLFRERHNGVEVIVHDLTIEDWGMHPGAPIAEPESVPAYVLIDDEGGRPPRTMETRGVLSASDLARWIFGPTGTP